MQTQNPCTWSWGKLACPSLLCSLHPLLLRLLLRVKEGVRRLLLLVCGGNSAATCALAGVCQPLLPFVFLVLTALVTLVTPGSHRPCKMFMPNYVLAPAPASVVSIDRVLLLGGGAGPPTSTCAAVVPSQLHHCGVGLSIPTRSSCTHRPSCLLCSARARAGKAPRPPRLALLIVARAGPEVAGDGSGAAATRCNAMLILFSETTYTPGAIRSDCSGPRPSLGLE